MIWILVMVCLCSGWAMVKGEKPAMSENMETGLLIRDQELSRSSGKKGILVALSMFMAEDGILLPANGHPLYGKPGGEILQKQMDRSLPGTGLTWEPLQAGVSSAGDLGYTHGRFLLEPGKKPASGTIKYGYYLTVWKRKPGGPWQVAFSQGLILFNELNQPAPGSERRIDETKVDEVTREVLAVEREFSSYSQKKGTREAFYRYIDERGMALGNSGEPRTKKDFAPVPGKESNLPVAGGAVLSWEPMDTLISSSGDMAFNYGPYIYTVTGLDGKPESYYGYFATVWKKERDQSWKFLIDGGNQVKEPVKK